jgi:hypothetical protein
MKLYLDDERPTPAGWIGVKWPDEAIAYLETGSVTDLSLDHDLGDDERGCAAWISTTSRIGAFCQRIGKTKNGSRDCADCAFGFKSADFLEKI